MRRHAWAALPPERDTEPERANENAYATVYETPGVFAMLIQALKSSPAQWPERVVHDTVAAIARHAAYERSLTDSLWLRFLRWLGQVIRDFREFFAGSPTGRLVTYGLLVLVIVLVIARIFINASEDGPLRLGGALRRERAGGNDPWAEAERLAGAGRFTDAAHALFAALLGAFAARGELRLHPSKTTGDYARDLRRKGSPAVRGFSAFRLRYDRVIYGLMECTADDYAALLREARPMLDSRGESRNDSRSAA